MLRRPLLLLAVLSSLAGCDQLGIEAASVTAARMEADGKAVGAACRHGGRPIEDCFALNRKVDKAAIYAGWREMDDYMRENKLDALPATLGPDGKPKGAAGAASAADGDADGASAPEAAKPVAKAEKPAPAKPRAEKSAAASRPAAASKPEH